MIIIIIPQLSFLSDGSVSFEAVGQVYQLCSVLWRYKTKRVFTLMIGVLMLFLVGYATSHDDLAGDSSIHDISYEDSIYDFSINSLGDILDESYL